MPRDPPKLTFGAESVTPGSGSSPTPCRAGRRRHSQTLRHRKQTHYTRDVTLREDASRIRRNPGISARLRSFAYNILRFNQSDTITQDRYASALGGLTFLSSLN